MRASRLLQMLLLLQNRGRQSCAQLARELEVTRRTVLRDVDALTEAGLPIVVLRGPGGGIELGFNYRTRLTGLAADEAEALAVLLSQPLAFIDHLGLRASAIRAIAKLIESFPDATRAQIAHAKRRFQFRHEAMEEPDPRIPALAGAIRERRIVRIQAHSPDSRIIHPIGLEFSQDGVVVIDGHHGERRIAFQDIGTINISADVF